MKAIGHFLLTAVVSIFVFCDAQAGQGGPGYLSVTGPCGFEFPQDHGAHPGYRTEWWYYTGNLSDASGRRFGFQLTIFRHQISPIDADRNWPDSPSGWRTRQLYMGHAAISDIANRQHHFDETVARGALNLAGVRQADDETHVFVKNWSIRIEPDQHRLIATTPHFSLDLILRPLKPLIAHGDQGYSLKGDTPERASCYYSFTRLETQGMVALNGRSFTVSGQSWMDHEFSSAPLQPGLSGWDWFGLQLSDNSELVIGLLRQKDGGLNQASSGTLVRADATRRHLTIDDFSITSRKEWKSPQSGAVYPQGWLIEIPSERIVLGVESAFAEQEMRTESSVGVTYWEGSVTLEGEKRGLAVTGTGYVEMTGYFTNFDR